MIRYLHLQHRFVKHIPDTLEPGVLYISIDFASAAHSCCCGCGEEVVTPITPTDWKLQFDGETVSLTPSVGNWNLPCRSHYVISRCRVIEATPWTDEQVAAEWRRDRAAKAAFYGTDKTEAPDRPETTAADESPADDRPLWKRFSQGVMRFWRR